MSQIDALFKKLGIFLSTATFLATNTNPVTRAGIKGDELEYVLGQYSLFPKHIVSMLTLAKNTAHRNEWTEVARELDHNIGQELGSDSGNLPHYHLLATSMRSEFDLNVWAAIPSPATDRFIRRMWSALKEAPALSVMGAAYALESSAVPELTVVLDMVQRLAGDRALLPQTQHFFHKHLSIWEPSHEAELREVLKPLLSGAQDIAVFEDGFIHVMNTMRYWWDALALEAA